MRQREGRKSVPSKVSSARPIKPNSDLISCHKLSTERPVLASISSQNRVGFSDNSGVKSGNTWLTVSSNILRSSGNLGASSRKFATRSSPRSRANNVAPAVSNAPQLVEIKYPPTGHISAQLRNARLQNAVMRQHPVPPDINSGGLSRAIEIKLCGGRLLSHCSDLTYFKL